uniref:Ribosomal protein S4/S9 N-terminal domain-containing protein n=1 Tax=Panagrolaimus sp. JU765 TaxID=591449 RepID=A0AC34QKJ6_9BILA
MPRKFKHHEEKLLKKVDFVNWKGDNSVHEGKILKKFCLRKRSDYVMYNTLSKEIREVAALIKNIPDGNPNKKKLERKLLSKLYNIGLIPAIDELEHCEEINASTFCRRRLPSVMAFMKMCANIEQSTKFVEQGHVRLGVDLVTDPAFIVTRTMSDLITWANASKIRKHVESYNNIRDDFEI